MAIQTESILDHFRNRMGNGRGRYLHNVTYHLLALILRERKFDSIGDASLSFCENANKLTPWLPSENDRIIFSIGLGEGLRA